jgi:hypothetical protein
MTRRDVPPEWSRSFTIDSLAAACAYVETVWHDDERVVPSRLHQRGPQPRDLSGSPRWAHAFAKFIFASPDETEEVLSGHDEYGEPRYHEEYRYPLYRALSLLARRQHDRWTKDSTRRPFHPSVVSVLRAMAKADFRPELVRLRYSDGTRVPPDLAELFCVGAARKLRGCYVETYVSWVDKSASQRAAENGHEAA